MGWGGWGFGPRELGIHRARRGMGAPFHFPEVLREGGQCGRKAVFPRKGASVGDGNPPEPSQSLTTLGGEG